MARKALKSQPEASVSTDGGTTIGNGFAATESISKSEAVRRALSDGVDQPADGVAYIRDNFGLEIGPQHFSAVKSTHLKKQGRVKVRVKGREKAAPKQAPAAPTADAIGENDLIAAMEAMKPLVASLGKEQVKRIVDLLG